MTAEACWSTIGVWSPIRASCPVLAECTHCRNCGVYIEKGRALLERSADAEVRAQWTTAIATPPQHEGELSASVFAFRLEDEFFALETRYFDEVVRNRKVHTIPHKTGRLVRGFVSFRGRLELCVSLSELLGVEKSHDERAAGRLLVVSPNEEARYLFAATAVLGTCRFPLASLQAPPGGSSAFAYLRGVFPWQDQVVGLLDPLPVFEALARSMAGR